MSTPVQPRVMYLTCYIRCNTLINSWCNFFTTLGGHEVVGGLNTNPAPTCIPAPAPAPAPTAPQDEAGPSNWADLLPEPTDLDLQGQVGVDVAGMSVQDA